MDFNYDFPVEHIHHVDEKFCLSIDTYYVFSKLREEFHVAIIYSPICKKYNVYLIPLAMESGFTLNDSDLFHIFCTFSPLPYEEAKNFDLKNKIKATNYYFTLKDL